MQNRKKGTAIGKLMIPLRSTQTALGGVLLDPKAHFAYLAILISKDQKGSWKMADLCSAFQSVSPWRIRRNRVAVGPTERCILEAFCCSCNSLF